MLKICHRPKKNLQPVFAKHDQMDNFKFNSVRLDSEYLREPGSFVFTGIVAFIGLWECISDIFKYFFSFPSLFLRDNRDLHYISCRVQSVSTLSPGFAISLSQNKSVTLIL